MHLSPSVALAAARPKALLLLIQCFVCGIFVFGLSFGTYYFVSFLVLQLS